jgi:hypothetical protein
LGLTEACTLEQAQRIFDTNFFGAVRMNRAVLPHMRRHGSGLVVHISGAGRVGIPGLGFYSATKFALEALAEAYRHELASQGIESAIVEPSAFFTPLFQKQEEAGDTLRSSSYGPASDIPKNLLKRLTSSPLNLQEVADSVVGLIESPAGDRPLRLTVGLPVASWGGFNYFSAQLQKDVLNWAGNASLATFQAQALSSARVQAQMLINVKRRRLLLDDLGRRWDLRPSGVCNRASAGQPAKNADQSRSSRHDS